MSDHPAPPDPLAALRGQFPWWETWTGVSGLRYARRRKTSPPVVFRADSTEALARMIREHEQARP